MTKHVIDNKPVNFTEYIRRIVQYRSLIITLAKRDLKAKYAQTVLGFLWAIIQPLAALIIFSVFFQGFIKLETGDVPYPIFAFSGMILWYYFSSIVSQSGSSLISQQDLIKKIYFPRIILPISKLFVGLFELIIAFVLLVIMFFVFKVPITPKILLAPLMIAMVMFTGFSFAIWLSALTVRRRDFLHIIPYLINYGIWLTPVFYPVTIIPEAYREWIYYLNPMATSIDLFRSSLFGTPFEWGYAISFIWVLIVFISGIYVFRKTEGNIADYV